MILRNTVRKRNNITISILAEVTRKRNRILTINLQSSGQDLLVLIHLTKFNHKNLRL